MLLDRDSTLTEKEMAEMIDIAQQTISKRILGWFDKSVLKEKLRK